MAETSIENRICLKIVLDKWLLQQALFRGNYTRTVTLSALLKLFRARDPRIETLMVVSYNPSHSNINSEVNAPFKMLSLLLRFLENENKPTNNRGLSAPADYDDSDEERKPMKLGSLAGYSMQRKMDDQELGVEPGDRIDTMGGDDSDEDDTGVDRLDVCLDDIDSGEEMEDMAKLSDGDNEEEGK